MSTMTAPQTPSTQSSQPEEWRISKRGKACVACSRVFKSEEEHYSGIVEVEQRFERRDLCLPCWAARPELFSFWKTRMPKIEQKRFEDVQAMVEFFKRLVEKPSAPAPEGAEAPAPEGAVGPTTRDKITYLMALLLARKRRVKLAGSKDGKLRVEKTWDGDAVEIADPIISDAELADLRTQMEQLFNVELGSPEQAGAQPEPAPPSAG